MAAVALSANSLESTFTPTSDKSVFISHTDLCNGVLLQMYSIL